jgi:ACS family tartrate transporter-like MFS transporter
MVLLIMGVTGSGKSTIARLISARTGWTYIEADDFHSPSNKQKMQAGIALSDSDRIPWLQAIHQELLRQNSAGQNVVLACSALKESYRQLLAQGLSVKTIFLQGSYELIRTRLHSRHGHFAGEKILADQFANLEPPLNATIFKIDPSPEDIAQEILTVLELPTTIPIQLSPTESASIIRKMRWKLLPFLFLLYVAAYLDRINVGFAALQMKDQLGFNDEVYGFGAGIFFLGYFLFQVPSSFALRKWGARRWIAFLMLLWGAISASTLFVHSASSFFTLRFLLGAAEAGFFPGVIYYLRTWFPANARAGVVALFMTAGPVSGIIGGPISGALLELRNLRGLAGWQWMFLLEGIPAILLGCAAYFFLQDNFENVSWLSEHQKGWLRLTLQMEEGATSQVITKGHASWIAKFGLGNAALWAFALIYFCLNTCTYGVSLWLPSALHALSGLSPLRLGALSTIPYATAAVIMVLVGAHSDRTEERNLHVALSAIAGTLALIMAGAELNIAFSIAAFAVALAASSSMTGPFWAMASAKLPKATAAVSIAFINALGNMGSGFGPYWIGYLRRSTGSFRAGLFSVAAFLLIAAITSVALRPVRAIAKS